jgi:hypothetical protein
MKDYPDIGDVWLSEVVVVRPLRFPCMSLDLVPENLIKRKDQYKIYSASTIRTIRTTIE